jgi:hypothetical protein
MDFGLSRTQTLGANHLDEGVESAHGPFPF